jgi:hypothetical protein
MPCRSLPCGGTFHLDDATEGKDYTTLARCISVGQMPTRINSYCPFCFPSVNFALRLLSADPHAYVGGLEVKPRTASQVLAFSDNRTYVAKSLPLLAKYF